jgi:hypothetical protein
MRKIIHVVIYPAWTRQVMDQKYLIIDLRQVDPHYTIRGKLGQSLDLSKVR